MLLLFLDEVVTLVNIMSSCNYNGNPIHYLYSRQVYGKPTHQEKVNNERINSAKSLYHTDLYSHYGCVNALEFSPNGDFLFSGSQTRHTS